MLHVLTTVALGPVLLVQGWQARRRIPRLPEPSGARAGRRGRGPGLRVLILGDSAAAGVGVESQDRALVGRVARNLANRFTVDWVVLAETGATTADTLRRLEAAPDDPFDAAVISLGVNDLTRGVRRRTWIASQRRLRASLRTRLGVRRIVACGLPPVGRFPALPQPLRGYLGAQAARMTADLERDVLGEPDVTFLDLEFALDAGAMATDGFHPGPAVYAAWGARVATILGGAFAPEPAAGSGPSATAGPARGRLEAPGRDAAP